YDVKAEKTSHYVNLEKVFGILMIVTACSMAFAHGSNDVANAIGPVAAVVSVVQSGGVISPKAELVWWVLPIGALGIVLGLAMFGCRDIDKIGTVITHMTSSLSFATVVGAVTIRAYHASPG